MGLAAGGFGPVAVTDARLLTPVPAGWSFARAASVPVVFLTAYYGLVDLAGLRPGESRADPRRGRRCGHGRHPAGRHLGAEVYATASPGKWGVLAWGSTQAGSPRRAIRTSRRGSGPPPAGAASTWC